MNALRLQKAFAICQRWGHKGIMGSESIDSVSEVSRVLTLEGQALLDCAKRVQSGAAAGAIQQALHLLKTTLERGGKIVVTGVGKSGKVAQKIAATLSSTGSLSVFLHPTEGLHGDLGVVTSLDCVLALSYTGNTDELVRLLPSLKKLKIPVIGIGGNSQSKLALQSDAWIDGFVSQEACPHNLAPTTSTTLALALGDALAITLMQLRGFDARAFALNHPGGSLGNRLTLSVSDVMHAGEKLPVISPDSSMEEAVVVSTQHKLGAVLVCEGEKLSGIITDGDLRRALQHREKFFQLKASEVMTRQPVTVSPEMMGVDAVAVMQNRPSQIAVLPVVNAQGHLVGLVRLHDLIQVF